MQVISPLTNSTQIQIVKKISPTVSTMFDNTRASRGKMERWLSWLSTGLAMREP